MTPAESLRAAAVALSSAASAALRFWQNPPSDHAAYLAAARKVIGPLMDATVATNVAIAALDAAGASGVEKAYSVPMGPPVKCKGFVSYPVHAIFLRQHGDRVLVEVEREDGKWCRAIQESGNFSHEVTANGLDSSRWYDSFEEMLAAEAAAAKAGKETK